MNLNDTPGVTTGKAPSISDERLHALARIGCGGENTRWSFSDEGLRRTIRAALRALGVKGLDDAQG